MLGANAFDAGSRSHNLLSVDLFVHHTSLLSCPPTTRRLVHFPCSPRALNFALYNSTPPTFSTMAFNSQYDRLNLTPAFTFPEDHSFGNDHSFMTSEDPLAQPRQPVSLSNFYCLGVCGRAPYPLQNLWTTQDVISFMQAGPSRAPVEHEEGPVAEYASRSLFPSFDIWADMPAPYTTSQGPLNEMSEGLGTGLEVRG